MNKIALSVALVMGTLAVLISRAHVSGVRAREEALSMVVVTRDLKPGDSPSGAMEEYLLPEEFEDGVKTAVKWSDRSLVKSSRVVTDVKKGSFLLWSHFEGEGRQSSSALLDILSPGKRAIALPLGWMEAVGGHVRPGDYVDIVATFKVPDRDGKVVDQTVTVEQNAKILATEGQTSYDQAVMAGNSNRNQYQSVLLEVTPLQAQTLSFAFGAGKSVVTVLRRPDDQQEIPVPNMNWLSFSERGVSGGKKP